MTIIMESETSSHHHDHDLDLEEKELVQKCSSRQLTVTTSCHLDSNETALTKRTACCRVRQINTLRYNKMLCFLIMPLWLAVGVSGNYWRRLAPLPADLTLGQSCTTSMQCLLFIPNSHCVTAKSIEKSHISVRHDANETVCACQPYHVMAEDKKTCLPASLLGYPCSIAAQCSLKVPNSVCSPTGRCACPSNLIPYRKDKCLAESPLHEYCLNGRQCSLYDPFTTCKWIIPKIYGKCTCLAVGYIEKDRRCLPEVGSRCEKTSDCEQLTPNSFCRTDSMHYFAANSVFKTTSRKMCACRDGYRRTKKRSGHGSLSCEPVGILQVGGNSIESAALVTNQRGAAAAAVSAVTASPSVSSSPSPSSQSPTRSNATVTFLGFTGSRNATISTGNELLDESKPKLYTHNHRPPPRLGSNVTRPHRWSG